MINKNNFNYNNLSIFLLIIIIFVTILCLKKKKTKKEKEQTKDKQQKKEIKYLNSQNNKDELNKNSNKNDNKKVKKNPANNKTTEKFHNNQQLSFWQYKDLKAHERIINPLLPPERSYQSTYGIPINIPTRETGSFQQVGALYKENINSEEQKSGNNDDSVILPLYGKPLWKGSNKWSYYITSDKNNFVKIPLKHKGQKCNTTYGCEEIQNDDLITIPEYNGVFRVTIYDYDTPSYIPCL